MAIRICAALAFLLFAGTVDAVAGQKPVITVATVQSSLAENPNAVTRTTTTTLSTTRTSSATFTVRSDRIVPSNLTVQYSISGTALAGKDYQALTGTVTIPAGQTSASITVTPIDDSEDELDETVAITILATLRSPYSTTRPNSGRTTILDDDNVRIIGLDLSPDTVLGGQTRDLRVTVSGAAPPGGLVVSVASGNASAVPDAQTTIAAGTRVGIVRLATNAVSSTVAVPLTVREPNGSSSSTTLTVQKEPVVSFVSFRFWDNYGGREWVGSFTLDERAPPGGYTVPVTLTVVSPAGAPLPASAASSVTVQGGSPSAALRIATQPVNVRTDVEVRVGTGSRSASQVIEVYPIPRAQGLAVAPDPVPGADSVDVRITLDQPVGPRLPLNVFVTGNPPVDLSAAKQIQMRQGDRVATVRVGTLAVADTTVAVVRAGVDPNQPGTTSANFRVTPPMPRFVSFRFWDNFGGQDYIGSVNIDRPAPAGGMSLPISLKVLTPAGAPLPASAPATVTFGAGQQSATLTVSTQPVSTVTRVEVRAGSGTASVARTIDIYPVPQVQSLTVSPDPAASSDSVDIRVQLDQVVGPRLGQNVFLSGSGPVRLSPFTRMLIQIGNREATLRVGTDAVTAPTTASVNASLDRSSPGPWNTAFTVAPAAPMPGISVVAFNNATVIGGTSVPVTLVLTGPVPAGRSLTLNLAASDPVFAPNPSTVTIPGGQATATVTVQTRTVTQQTQGALRADVAGGNFAVGTVTVQPQPVTLAGFTLSQSQVVGGNTATPVTGTVRLSVAAPQGGVVVGVSSSHPQSVLVPSTVTVPAGLTSVSFAITTLVVPNAIDALVTASFGTLQMPEMLRVEPQPPRLTTLSFNPTTVAAGSNATGRIDLSAPAPVPVTVGLASSNASAAALPASVTVPAGQASATFQLAGGSVSATTTVQVTATLGTTQVGASVTVQPAVVVSALAADPSAVIGGGELALTVTLSAPAGPGGMTVNMSSNAPGIVPSSTVQIPAGQASASTTFRTAATGSGSQVRLSAGASSVTTDVRVLPLPIDRIQSAGSIRAGDVVDLEIRLQQPAPAGGLRVPLSSSLPNVIPVPAFVDIPAGATSGTVSVQTRPVPGDNEVTVTAGVAPGSSSRSIRVRS